VTDVATNTSDATAAPPPIESDSIDVVSRAVPDAIDRGNDDANIQAAVAEVRKRREQSEEPFEQLRYEGREHGTKTLREASRDVSDYHRMKRPDARAAVEVYGGKRDEVLVRAKDPEFIAQLRPDWSRVEVEEFCRTGEEPPTRVGVVTHGGKLVRPLDDSQPVTAADAFANHYELKKGVKNFRELQAAAAAQLADELMEQEQAAAGQQASAEQAAPHQQATHEQQRPAQPASTPQQSDPLAPERQQLAQERDAYLRARYGSAAEEKAAAQIEAWNAALLRQFPEAANKAAVEELSRTNPARAQQLAQAVTKTTQAINQWMVAGARATAERERAASDLAVIQNAQVRAAWHRYKDAEDAKIAQIIPTDPHQASVLRTGVRKMLNEIGFGEDELNAAWDGRAGFSVRDARAQRLILDAYRYRAAQAKAKNVTKAGLPPV
jgi:hypothetical protein